VLLTPNKFIEFLSKHFPFFIVGIAIDYDWQILAGFEMILLSRQLFIIQGVFDLFMDIFLKCFDEIPVDILPIHLN